MNKKEFEKKKGNLWAAAEERHAVYIPNIFRAEFEKKYGVFHGYRTDLEDLEMDIDEQAKLLSLVKNPKGTDIARQNDKKSYRRCSDKRMYLIEFVIKYYLEQFKNALDIYIKPPRFKWQRITERWNKVHPGDFITWPALKVNFYRAKKKLPNEYNLYWEWLMFPCFFLIGKGADYTSDNEDVVKCAEIIQYLIIIRLNTWLGVLLSDKDKWFIEEVESINQDLDKTFNNHIGQAYYKSHPEYIEKVKAKLFYIYTKYYFVSVTKEA